MFSIKTHTSITSLCIQTHTHTAAENEKKESTHKLNGANGCQPGAETCFLSLTRSKDCHDKDAGRGNGEGTHTHDSGLETQPGEEKPASYLLAGFPTVLQNHCSDGQPTHTGD